MDTTSLIIKKEAVNRKDPHRHPKEKLLPLLNHGEHGLEMGICDNEDLTPVLEGFEVDLLGVLKGYGSGVVGKEPCDLQDSLCKPWDVLLFYTEFT